MNKLASILCLLLLFQINAQGDFDYKKFTNVMCTPEFHGRGYVGGGDSIAAAYIAKNYAMMGITPVSNNYYQPFSLSVNTFPDSCGIFFSGQKLIPGQDFIVTASSSGTCTNPPCRPTLFYSKFVSGEEFLKSITTGDIKEFKLKENDILIVKNLNYSLDSSRKISYLISQYAQFKPVIELVNKKFTWSVSSMVNGSTHLQVQASALFNQTDGIEISINIRNQFLKAHKARNVIGVIESRKKAKSTIMLTAHYDHLGRLGSETFFPGGNDNASGVAMMLSVAEKFKIKPLKNTQLMIVAFAGEEIGLLGSKYLSEHPIIPLDNIKFQLNMDIMGSGEKGITAVNGRIFKKEFKKLQKLNKKMAAVLTVKARGKAANSDHHHFTEKGVPGFFIYTMGNNQNYHDVYDTYEALSFSSFEGLSSLFEKFIRKL
tara:strand:- start:322 stop:1611 length:1290 start_codon:yes stop_codon:yes gene_type:complete